MCIICDPDPYHSVLHHRPFSHSHSLKWEQRGCAESGTKLETTNWKCTIVFEQAQMREDESAPFRLPMAKPQRNWIKFVSTAAWENAQRAQFKMRNFVILLSQTKMFTLIPCVQCTFACSRKNHFERDFTSARDSEAICNRATVHTLCMYVCVCRDWHMRFTIISLATIVSSSLAALRASKGHTFLHTSQSN